jgi:aquaporin Z
LLWFLQHPRLRAFTPALFPRLYAVMVLLEANRSGTR